MHKGSIGFKKIKTGRTYSWYDVKTKELYIVKIVGKLQKSQWVNEQYICTIILIGNKLHWNYSIGETLYMVNSKYYVVKRI